MRIAYRRGSLDKKSSQRHLDLKINAAVPASLTTSNQKHHPPPLFLEFTLYIAFFPPRKIRSRKLDMPTILIIGATRGLGAALANAYASVPSNAVFGTTRSGSAPKKLSERIMWVKDIDLMSPGCGARLVDQCLAAGVSGGMAEGEGEGKVRGFDVVVRRPSSEFVLGGKN